MVGAAHAPFFGSYHMERRRGEESIYFRAFLPCSFASEFTVAFLTLSNANVYWKEEDICRGIPKQVNREMLRLPQKWCAPGLASSALPP